MISHNRDFIGRINELSENLNLKYFVLVVKEDFQFPLNFLLNHLTKQRIILKPLPYL